MRKTVLYLVSMALAVLLACGVALAANIIQCPTEPHGWHCYGTPEDDVLTGSAERDHIDGYGGNDIIYGKARIDHLEGGEGNDRLHGGPGNEKKAMEEASLTGRAPTGSTAV